MYVGYTTRPTYAKDTSTIHSPPSEDQRADRTDRASSTTETMAVSVQGYPTVELDFEDLGDQPNTVRVIFREEE